MFEKRVDEQGDTYYENDQCRAFPDFFTKVIYLPYFLGYGKGVCPPKGGGHHAKAMLSWLVRETGINRFVITNVLAPEDYITKLHGVLVVDGTDTQVRFDWNTHKCIYIGKDDSQLHGNEGTKPGTAV